MLSKANSNAAHDFRRSKSTSSTTEHRKHVISSESIDPETAKLHAVVAAQRAMGSSHQSTIHPLSRNESQRSAAAPTPRSVRFSSPVTHHVVKSKPKQFDTAESSSPRGSTYDTHHLLPPPYHHVLLSDDTHTSKETYSAAPSSYRRLKTSKSLSDTSYQAQKKAAMDRNPPSLQSAAIRNAKSSSSLRGATSRPRLKRSFFLLRSTRHRTDPLIPYQPELTCRPESIALARSQFLQSLSAPSTSTTPNQNPPNFATECKVLQETMLTPPLETLKDHDTASDPKVYSRHEKHSISTSLRRRFRKTFAKFRPTRNELPPQQLTASSNHFQPSPTDARVDTGFDSYYNKAGDSERRRSLYDSPTVDADPFEAMSNLENNFRSTVSSSTPTSTSQSRLTSWANSSSSNSIRGNLFEQKRLSVIKEDGGPHQPSSSVGRHIGGVSVFRQPLRLDDNTPVNNHRLYSALVRRIDEEQEGMTQEGVIVQGIQKDQDSTSSAPKTTVRAVSTLPSATLSESVRDEGPTDRYVCNDSPSAIDNERRHCPKQLQDKHSIFFASTAISKPQTQSPFRKLLAQTRERRSGDETDHSESGSVRVYRAPLDAKNGAFAESSDSLYSKTTNGGINQHYVLRSNSSDSFLPSSGLIERGSGTAVIYPSEHPKSHPTRQAPAPGSVRPSATLSEKGAWRGWIEGQLGGIARLKSGVNNHIRENAQIDPEDVELGRLSTSDEFSDHQKATIYRSTEVKASASAPDPQPLSRDSAREGQMMSKSISRAKLSLAPTHATENQSQSISINAGLQMARKISLTTLTKVVRSGRSQPVLTSTSTGKENKPNSTNTRLQVSTPSQRKNRRVHIGSEFALRETSSNLLQENAQGRGSSVTPHTEAVNDSPSEKYKNLLSARLSRPFDMDVPECNRPFDSMYLGHNGYTARSNGSSNDRLSVATGANRLRPTKSYGGLGLSTLHPGVRSQYENDDKYTTALPRLPRSYPIARTTSIESSNSSKKQIISDFIRNRRKNSQDKKLEPPALDAADSPVFI